MSSGRSSEKTYSAGGKVSAMSGTHDRGTIEDFGRWREFSAGMWA